MLTRMILFAYELVLKRAFSYKVLVAPLLKMLISNPLISGHPKQVQPFFRLISLVENRVKSFRKHFN